MNDIITRKSVVSRLPGNIIIIKINDGAEIELEDRLEIGKVTFLLSGGRKYVVLVDAPAFVNISKEAREYYRSEDYVNCLAQAFVVKSLASRLLGNFMIKFHKLTVATKLFYTRETAMEWLMQYISEPDLRDELEQRHLRMIRMIKGK